MSKVFHKLQMSHKIFLMNQYLKYPKEFNSNMTKKYMLIRAMAMVRKKYSLDHKYVIASAWKGRKLWNYYQDSSRKCMQ